MVPRDTSKICRLCLKQNLEPSEIATTSNALKNLISQFFYIQISSDDKSIPNSICHVCAKLVTDFSAFQVFVASNQERMVSLSVPVIENPLPTPAPTPSPPLIDEMCGIRIPENLEKLVKDLELDKELIEIDTNSLNFAPTIHPKYCCRICGKISLNEDDYEIHQFYHELPDKPFNTFQCEICAKSYKERYLYKRHLKTHIIDPQMCQICDKEFENQTKLDQHHLNCHIPLIYFLCDICDKLCPDKRALTLHMQLKHVQQKLVKCNKCHIRLSSHRGLQRHNRTVHDPNVKKYDCEYCNKQFKSRRALDNHETRHVAIEASKIHSCDFCDERFRDLEACQAHRVNEHPLQYANKRQERFTINQDLENKQAIKIALL